MLFRRNKFKKINRSEVTDRIVDFENERNQIEERIFDKEYIIRDLYNKGCKEKSIQSKQLLASKIKRHKEENNKDMHRLQYLTYNINLLDKLKTAIDDQKFFEKNANNTINRALRDSKSLTEFLQQAYLTRTKAEDALIGSTEIFNEFAQDITINEEIYNVSETEHDIILQFEKGGFMDFEDNDQENIVRDDTKDKEVI